MSESAAYEFTTLTVSLQQSAPECTTLHSRQFPESSTIKALEFNFSICQESLRARVKAVAAAVKSSPQPKRQISSLSC